MAVRHRALWAALIVVGVVVLACRDLAAPASRATPTAPVAHVTIPSDSDLAALESPASATAHLSILPNGGYDAWPVIGNYPTRTIIHAQITGSASATPWPPGPWTFTEKGYLGNCLSWIPQLNGGWTMCAASAYAPVVGSPQLQVTVTMPAGCGPPPAMACPSFTGGFDATLTRLDADLEVTPTDTTLKGGGYAIIHWHATPDSLHGYQTPLLAKRAFYEPDSAGTPADSTVQCVTTSGGYFYQTNYCQLYPRASGTLHIWALVNGKLVQKTAHITVPTLQMTATPPAGTKGYVVTFTPVWSDGTPTTAGPGWAWRPDTPPAATWVCPWAVWRLQCVTAAEESGTMTASLTVNGYVYTASAHATVYSSFTLDASSNRVRFGDTVTFTPKYDGTPRPAARWRWAPDDTAHRDGASCGTTLPLCKQAILESGTMWAFTSATGGQGDSASQHVGLAPRITIACTPLQLTRTDPVSCHASADGSIAVTGWTFLPVDHGVDGARTRTIAPTSVDWNGPAVTSGSVFAAGTVNGESAISDTATFIVNPRTGADWDSRSDTVSVDAADSVECNRLPHFQTDEFGITFGHTTCEPAIYFDPDPTIAPGVAIDSIAFGPNEGLWYVSSTTLGVYVQSQVLKDLRPDGRRYPVVAGDSVVAGCQSAGISDSATVTDVNLTCMHYSGSLKFDGLYSFTWTHERCHRVLVIHQFELLDETLGDIRAFAEEHVRPGSVALRAAIEGDPNGVNDLNSQIARFSSLIDAPSIDTYSFWSRDASDNLWYRRSYPPNAILSDLCTQ